MVSVYIAAADRVGIGHTYTAAAATSLIEEQLAPILAGCDAIPCSICSEQEEMPCLSNTQLE